MAWWRHLALPARRAWLAVSARVGAHRKNGGGILKLHDDVQTCGYKDVQVMWDMLRRSEKETIDASKKKQRAAWRRSGNSVQLNLSVCFKRIAAT